MLPFLLGAVTAALLYLSAICFVSVVRLHRVNREWSLLAQRRELPV